MEIGNDYELFKNTVESNPTFTIRIDLPLAKKFLALAEACEESLELADDACEYTLGYHPIKEALAALKGEEE